MTIDLLMLSPVQRLALAYAGRDDRALAQWIFALDQRMAAIVRSTSEPVLGQLRLAWWRDSLSAANRPQGEALLKELTRLEGQYAGLGGRTAGLATGWEQLLDEAPYAPETVENFAKERGGAIFTAFGHETGLMEGEAIARAGQCWASWDLAHHLADPLSRERAFAHAAALWPDVRGQRWPRRLRPLSLLLAEAAGDLERGEMGQGRGFVNYARLVWHGLTGA